MKTKNNMNKKENILDLDTLYRAQIEKIKEVLSKGFSTQVIDNYLKERESETGPSTIHYLVLPESMEDELEVILGTNEEVNHIPYKTYLNVVTALIEGLKEMEEEEIIPEVVEAPLCGVEAKPDPDWILDTISYNSNYIKNIVKFLQGSGIKCEDYQEGNPYLIWNGYEAYFTPGFEEGCVAKTASDFVKDVMYTKLWPQIEAHLLGKPLESEPRQQQQAQPKQATLMDIARHMVIEAENQGIELGIGEDGLFTFKVLMPQQNEMNHG